MQTLIENTRQFLKENKIDYLLVPCVNEFLEEYTPLEENSRYALTGFSGSTGDALLSLDKLFLFVDGRYHAQADNEVDKTIVSVIKMKLGESLFTSMLEKLVPQKTLAVISTKLSQAKLEAIKKVAKAKQIKVKLLDFDIILHPHLEFQTLETRAEIHPSPLKGEGQFVDLKIAGLSTEEKIAKISQSLNSDEAVLVSNLEEISYLLNIRDFSKNYSSTVKHSPILILATGEYHTLDRSRVKFGMTHALFDSLNKIYVDKSSITAYDYQILGKKAKSRSGILARQHKSIKTQAEIEHYKKCFERTDKALYATRKFIEENENISEFDIAQKLEENFYKFGAKSLSFKSIVAKDKNSALAHYSKNSPDEIIKDGSLVLIDCGAYHEGGYATDITRVFVKGTPSKLQKQVYTAVLKSHLKAFNKKINEKTTGFDLDNVARNLLNKIKPEGFEFSHSLGHGIGISVHEYPPSLSPSKLAKVKLEGNMCFTIEPGLYNAKHFGVRLENSCYLAQENGQRLIKSFSDMCFEKKLIDFSMLTKTEKKQLNMFKVE